MKKLFTILLSISTFLLIATPASAHVVVQPSQVGIASFETFTVAVPTEKNIPTIAVRLLIPAGLSEVVPNVKADWTIQVKTDKNNDVTEIDWTGGNIPVGERDEFSFSAQVPAIPTTLDWKAYQTYQDNSIVSWADAPVVGKDDDTYNPYSTTKVINDLTGTTQSGSTNPLDTIAITLSVIALIVACTSLVLKSNERK